jgi:hypothetical protein
MRILFGAMSNSVHVARWINQISDKGWDIRLFSSTPERIHPDLRNITAYGVSASRPEGLDPSVRLRGVWQLRRGSGLVSYLALRYPALPFSLLTGGSRSGRRGAHLESQRCARRQPWASSLGVLLRY